MKNINILIVEDEAIVAMDLKRALRKMGYSILGVIRSGEEALEYLESTRSKPDIILMDIMLAGEMSGTQTAAEIKKRKNIPVIYITAYSDSHTLQSARMTDPFGYILKPFDEKILYISVEMALYKHELELEKSDYTRKLKELNESKDKFFSLISHDLRSPFNSILGSLEILKDEYDSLDEEERAAFISAIYDSTKNIYDHLSDLLDYSKSKIDNTYYPVKVNLNTIITKAIRLHAGSALKKNISIFSEVNEELYAYAEEDVLVSIFNNLISNAVKFTNRGGCINIISKENGKFISTEVSDTGIGMDEASVDNLFKLEKKQSTPGTNNEPGTGLGLIIVKELTEKSGGNITVRSKKSEGTSFTIAIPKASHDI